MMTGPQPAFSRPFISVMFECCHVYSRVYRNTDGTAYNGRCPKCLSPVRALVGEGGTQRRIFRAN